MTGQELRARREAAEIKAYEVAAEMRVHSSRVSQVESLAHVTPATADRYLVALGRCLVAKTSAPTAVA